MDGSSLVETSCDGESNASTLPLGGAARETPMKSGSGFMVGRYRSHVATPFQVCHEDVSRYGARAGPLATGAGPAASGRGWLLLATGRQCPGGVAPPGCPALHSEDPDDRRCHSRRQPTAPC